MGLIYLLLLVHTTVKELTLSTVSIIYNVRSINLKALYTPLLKNACNLNNVNWCDLLSCVTKQAGVTAMLRTSI